MTQVTRPRCVAIAARCLQADHLPSARTSGVMLHCSEVRSQIFAVLSVLPVASCRCLVLGLNATFVMGLRCPCRGIRWYVVQVSRAGGGKGVFAKSPAGQKLSMRAQRRWSSDKQPSYKKRIMNGHCECCGWQKVSCLD